MTKSKKKTVVSSDATIVSSVEEMKVIVESLKLSDKKIVFTNGTFDLLHVGHARCLKDAKSRGDYLVVGVNSDESVRAYKSPKLPIQNEYDRMELLTNLRWVDYVVPFSEKTADEIIRILEPDLVAKGTDYDPETMPEAETIAAYGGEVVICGDPKDHASSSIIQRIRELED